MAWSMGLLGASRAVAAGAYDLLETQVLGTTASSVTFTGLGSYTDYKHLQIRLAAQTTGGTWYNGCKVTFNSDTTNANYYYHDLSANGGSVSSSAAETPFVLIIPNATNVFGVGTLDVLDFASNNKRTTLRALTGTVGEDLASFQARIALGSLLWDDTSAVTSLTIATYANNFTANSRFSLYGVRG